MRWALRGSFEHSNGDLLALYICRGMIVFVIHEECHRGPCRSPGVPGASLGGLRDVTGASQGRPQSPKGVPRCPRGVPWGPRGVPGGPKSVPGGPRGVTKGIPGIPGGSGDVPGVPGILFIKMIP